MELIGFIHGRDENMQKNGMFRLAMFGGYNKEDVNNYIQTMENDMETVKLKSKKENTELKVELQKVRGDKEELEKKLEQYQKQEREDETEQEKNIEMPQHIQEEVERLKKENTKLKELLLDTKAEKARILEEKKKIQEKLTQAKDVKTNEERSQQLENEIRILKEKKEQYEEDYCAIAKVLEDARKSAQSMEEDAKKRAEELIAKAQRESDFLRENLKIHVDKDLEDKGIRLMAAKYKIESYRREINDTQQKLYNLYTDMGKMVENMPQRLEQLWEGDTYFQIPLQGESSEHEEHHKETDH